MVNMPKVDVNKKRNDSHARIELETFWNEVSDIKNPKNHNLTGGWDEDFGHIYPRYQDPENDLIVPLGRMSDGNYASLNLSIDLNLLAVGSALSGLGVFRRATLTHLTRAHTPEQLKIVIIDPIRALNDFDNIPHLATPRAVSEDQISNAIEWLQEEYERRIEVCKTGHKLLHIHNGNVADSEREPRLLVLVSEFGQLDFEDGRIKKLFAMVMSMARAIEINTVLCTQQPCERTLSDWLIDSIHSRIAFQLPYAAESVRVLGKTGAEELLGQGDMIYTDSENFWRLQGFHVA